MSRQRPTPAPSAGRPTADSFLLRLWQEPREAAGEAPRLRGYARNLRSGEERYVTDLEQLCDFLAAQVGLQRAAAGETAETPRADVARGRH